MSEETMHPEVSQFIAGLMIGLLIGAATGLLAMGIAMHRDMDKEVRACLQLPTIHEARRCWGEEL